MIKHKKDCASLQSSPSPPFDNPCTCGAENRIKIKVHRSEDFEIAGRELFRARTEAGLSRNKLAMRMKLKGFVNWNKVLIWRMELRTKVKVKFTPAVAKALFEALQAEPENE